MTGTLSLTRASVLQSASGPKTALHLNRRFPLEACLVLLLALCLSAPLAAQESELESMPGYVDFVSLSNVYGEPRVMINISGLLLQFMAAASENDPQSAELMRNLKGVRVNVYDTAGLMTPALEQIASVKEVLQKEGWAPVVQVKEATEQVQIFMKAGEEGMQGLTVMTVNAEEAVFINILGEIDPAQLSGVMDKLNVDVDVEGGGEK